MIKVVRVLGESFDLETQSETSKALVLSNGKRELNLYVEDDVARDVLQMMAEVEAKPVAPPSPEKPVIPLRTKTEPAVVHNFPAKPPAKPPPMASVSDAPEPEPEEFEDGYEPGEEYNDPATGAESL